MEALEITQHYVAKKWPELTKETLAIIVAQGGYCDCCGKNIKDMYDFPDVDDEGVMRCEDCYKEKYMSTCPICEEYFEKAFKPQDEVLIISKETVKEYGFDIKPGFYQVLEYPYYRAAVGFGFDGLFENAIQLIRELDINSMLNKIYPHTKHEINADECCHECMKKYTGQTPIINNYCNKKYGKKQVAIIKKAIKDGY